MRDLDRKAGGCVLAFNGILALGMAIPVLVAMRKVRDPFERTWGLVMALGLPLFMALITVALFAFQAKVADSPEVRRVLEQLRARIGGEILAPSFRRPFVQPRLTATVEGAVVEVRFIRTRGSAAGSMLSAAVQTPHAQLDTRPFGQRWTARVEVARQSAFKLSLGTRSDLSHLGISLVGLTEVRSGDPAWDARFTAATDRADAAARVLADPAFREQVTRLLTINAPMMTTVTFGPGSKLLLGALGQSPVPSGIDAARLGAIVDGLTAAAARVR